MRRGRGFEKRLEKRMGMFLSLFFFFSFLRQYASWLLIADALGNTYVVECLM